MSRMILYLHGSLRRLNAVTTPKPLLKPFCSRYHFLSVSKLAHCIRFGSLSTSLQKFVVRSFAANPSRPIDHLPSEDSAYNTILQEIRLQERSFLNKVQRTAGADLENRKLNASHLEDNLGVEMLRGSSATSAAPLPKLDNPLGTSTESEDKTARPFLLESTKTSHLFDHFAADMQISTGTGQESSSNVITAGTQLFTTGSKKPLTRIGQPINANRPEPTKQIIYPRNVERLQVNFKTPLPPERLEDIKLDNVNLPPPPPTGPRFLESTTHRIKTLLANRPADPVNNEINIQSRMVDLPTRSSREQSTVPAAPAIIPIREKHLGPAEEIVKIETDLLGNPVPPEASTLLTTILLQQDLKLPYHKDTRKERIGIIAKSSIAGNGGDSNSKEDKDEDAEQRNAKRWKRLKYTAGILGVATSLFGGYLMIVIGAPKCDHNGKLISDKYSHLPLFKQYFYRIKDEFENYKKLIKEPSRDKLLPDALEPPYYQPPYTLILEFTDLLVHPEWTYQSGWRFKKRPGVDQFLEALYTRFEVVVYTAQMGMTVFPIMEALDGKNLISYKLVRDATNFIGGDHVKDLGKINRDLSKVVVVDWNAQSVKLHKENLFQIPRWEGNDDDNTLTDLAAFLIAISEWEIQDVRSVLQYYGQFDNPLAKFKENQMQALQAT